MVALVASVFKSNAQTTVPFYGFELSNYEVGDTVEYLTSSYNASLGSSCLRREAFAFLGKTPIGTDSIAYEVAYTYYQMCEFPGVPVQQWLTKDTVERLLANDPVYGNDNNILDFMLFNCDSAAPNVCMEFAFDTINGLKHLKAELYNNVGWYSYEATENIGLTGYHYFDDASRNTDLVYARLQNYGVYGQWQPIYLSVGQAELQNALVEYDIVNKLLCVKNEANDYDALRLYDVSGRCVLNAEPNVKSVSLAYLTPGLYFYQLVGKESSSGKILVR